MKPNYTLLASEMHYSGAWNASGRLKEQAIHEYTAIKDQIQQS